MKLSTKLKQILTKLLKYLEFDFKKCLSWFIVEYLKLNLKGVKNEN